MTSQTDSLAKRLTDNLDVKNIIIEPTRVGKVAIIPIMMIDPGFGSGGEGILQSFVLGEKVFFMSGKVKLCEFVVISKAGT